MGLSRTIFEIKGKYFPTQYIYCPHWGVLLGIL